MTPADQLRAILAKHERIAIAGVPRSGKTTLSNAVTDRPVVHTDDYMAGSWEDAPADCAHNVPKGPVVIEGVRALAVTKLLGDVTCVVWLDEPRVELSPGQHRAVLGRRTNFAKWLREGHDVEVVRL